MTASRTWPKNIVSVAMLVLATSATMAKTHSVDNFRLDEKGVIKASYTYRLTRGRGEPVCDAFLKRLIATNTNRPPYCDIPEDDSIPGFTRLHRVPLTVDEADRVWPHVFGFTQFDQQKESIPGWEPPGTRLGSNVFAWRYDPPVSLSNNGVPENVLIWQGYGTTGDSIFVPCGGITMAATQDFEYEPPQIGFVLTPDNKQIDEGKTREIFGHPSGKAAEERRIGTSSYGFAPIGYTEGVFEYHGLYYIETFLSSLNGDLRGRYKNDPSIGYKLAVALRQKGKTRQVCEYETKEDPAP